MSYAIQSVKNQIAAVKREMAKQKEEIKLLKNRLTDISRAQKDLNKEVRNNYPDINQCLLSTASNLEDGLKLSRGNDFSGEILREKDLGAGDENISGAISYLAKELDQTTKKLKDLEKAYERNTQKLKDLQRRLIQLEREEDERKRKEAEKNK